MNISAEKIKEFQTLYKRRFGKKVSEKKAHEMGTKLVCFLNAVYSPMNKKEFETVKRSLAK